MAPNLAWGGFSNGRIPRENLVDIGGGKLLQADAAGNWRRFTAAFQSRWGDPLYLAGYQDAYRDWNRQKAMWDRYQQTGIPANGVASPGSSIHGWARSVDCSGYGAGGSARHNWMRQNAGTYGWSWSYGQSLNESWHWDYVGPITTTAGDGGYTPIEDTGDIEMKLVRHPSGAVALVGEFTFQVLNGNQYNVAVKIWGPYVQMASAEEYEQTRLDTLERATGFINAFPAVSGSFTAADRAMLDDIASKNELTSALTSTVSLINSHADTNKGEILEAIEEIPAGGGGGGNFALSLDIDNVPGTATGTAVPTA